ncbi:MAG: phosphodiester glycosidase family protein [Thermosynechococcaceae cyanobacterium MS004]|nr:phosphodiester glycosidase family protein [Thermosynechococcaceae cyanobacterium MS004]
MGVLASPVLAAPFQEGSQLLVNGQPFAGAWAVWSDERTGQQALGVSDSAWMRVLGGDLADSQTSTQQPAIWYSAAPIPLSTQWSRTGAARYLNITEAARQWGWRLQPRGSTLEIQTPPATIQSLRLGQQPWGRRLVVTLDRPTPWTLASLTNSRTGRTDRQFTIQVDAAATAGVLQDLKAMAGAGLKSLRAVPGKGQISIQGVTDGSFQPHIWTLDNPPRLVVDIRQTPMKSRRIQWAPGIEWREELVRLGQSQFPVTWLAVNPSAPGLKIQPFWGGSALVGINPLSAMAQGNQAAAAINAGYFARDRQTPLGAIRRNGTWISSPILNRGVIGWNAQGQFRVGRLMLQESLVTSRGTALAIASSNSGYPQRGMARYTPIWGAAYTPILKNEQIITVVNNQVQSQQAAGGVAIPIPRNGYLLVLRDTPASPDLAPGSQIQYQARPSLPEFEAMPEIMGAGPLLVANGRIVENAIAEQFSPSFAIQAADRSGIGQTANGTVLMAVTHNRTGGAGPTLREWAQIMQQLGSVNALNLDGGSSTALYLGGQLLDRHPKTAARVQNGIGIFLQPSP